MRVSEADRNIVEAQPEDIRPAGPRYSPPMRVVRSLFTPVT
jgi:hypothetical protein